MLFLIPDQARPLERQRMRIKRWFKRFKLRPGRELRAWSDPEIRTEVEDARKKTPRGLIISEPQPGEEWDGD